MYDEWFIPVCFRRVWAWFLLGGLLLIGGLWVGAAPAARPSWFQLPAIPGFSTALLWTGSWDLSGSMVNRGDLRLNALGLAGSGVGALGLSARVQVVDKRPALFWEHPEEGGTAFAGGLYHNATGSRLLYGILEEWGLSARVRNPWGKSPPFVEARKPLMADLRTEPSSTREAEVYLYLGAPRLGIFRPFATAQLDQQLQAALGGGLDVGFSPKLNLRTEGFYTEKRLESRKSSTWFSASPPLPERDFRLAALGLYFSAPFIGLAADGAFSETFAWGRGAYGNLALRLGDRPWQFSLVADAGSSRYVDRGGDAAGAGFRTAARLEWKGRRSALFRANTTLRAPEPGAFFERSSSALYYRFPTGASTGFPLRLTRISASADRDARDREAVLDSLGASVGLGLGPLRAVLDGGLAGTVAGDTAGEASPEDANAGGASPEGASVVPASGDTAPFPYPGALAYDFSSVKGSGEISYYAGIFQVKLKLGYTLNRGKTPVWDTALSASIRGTPGRFTLKLSSPAFPSTWNVSFTWRLELKSGG
jgi:hypothetical protein